MRRQTWRFQCQSYSQKVWGGNTLKLSFRKTSLCAQMRVDQSDTNRYLFLNSNLSIYVSYAFTNVRIACASDSFAQYFSASIFFVASYTTEARVISTKITIIENFNSTHCPVPRHKLEQDQLLLPWPSNHDQRGSHIDTEKNKNLDRHPILVQNSEGQ